MYTAFIALGLALGANAQQFAYPLDVNYNGKGYKFNDPNPSTFADGSADAVLLNDDGTEYVGIKQLFNGDSYAITVLAKNKANGTRDSSFATNGLATENLTRDVRVTNIALLNNNSDIYCSGSGWGGYVWSNGVLAPQIYAGGVVQPSNIAQDGAKANDTSVVQVGDVNVIAFFKNNGSSTTNTYANDGYSYVTYPALASGTPVLNRVAAIVNGSYYVAGIVDSFAFIAKYNQRSFALDNTWGTNGVASFEISNLPYSHFADLKIQPDGKVVALYEGGFNNEAFYSTYVMRFNTNGALDTSFSSDGILSQPYSYNVAFLPNGVLAFTHTYDFGATHEVGVLFYDETGQYINQAMFSLTAADGSQLEANPKAISVNSTGDIAISGNVYDTVASVNKYFTMRLKRVVCSLSGTLSNITSTGVTITASGSFAYPLVVTVGNEGAVFTDTLTSGTTTTATGLNPNGTFVARIEDANGCSWEQQFIAEVTSGINESNSLKLNVYPNPANEFLIINCDEEIETTEVYNVVGEQVIFVKGQITKLNTAPLAQGMYSVQLKTTNGNTAVKKFMKQ